QTGDHCKNENALRVHEPAPPYGERMWEVVVLCDGAAKAREVRECSVGGERQNNQDRSHRRVIEDPFACNCNEKEGKHALIAGASRVRCSDAINADEIGDSREERHQKSNDYCERASCHRNHWFAKRFHPVAHSLDANHGGAAASKGLENDPSAGKRRGLRNRGGGPNRDWGAAPGGSLEQPDNRGRHERSPKPK